MSKHVVGELDAGKRLDVFVAETLDAVSRSYIRKLIDQNKITANDIAARANYRLHVGDIVVIDYAHAAASQIPEISLPILYEDSDCVVINKPVGVLTHSKGAYNPEATVATFISDKLRDMEGERAGIVHRLDRATSGVIICAKHPEALSWLQKQFSQRKVKKVYNAVIEGTIKPEHAVIDMPIERNPKNPQVFRVGKNGKPALTEYAVVDSNQKYSLLELKPTTGRTHQLRVHLARQKRPIIGDTFYDGAPADRLYLHALSLEITLPNKTRKQFTAELPSDFKEKLNDAS